MIPRDAGYSKSSSFDSLVEAFDGPQVGVVAILSRALRLLGFPLGAVTRSETSSYVTTQPSRAAARTMNSVDPSADYGKAKRVEAHRRTRLCVAPRGSCTTNHSVSARYYHARAGTDVARFVTTLLRDRGRELEDSRLPDRDGARQAPERDLEMDCSACVLRGLP